MILRGTCNSGFLSGILMCIRTHLTFWRFHTLTFHSFCPRLKQWVVEPFDRNIFFSLQIISVASSYRLPQSVFLVASFASCFCPIYHCWSDDSVQISPFNFAGIRIRLSHSDPLHFFQWLQPAPTRSVISVSISPSSYILVQRYLKWVMNYVQFQPYLYGVGSDALFILFKSELHKLICSQNKSRTSGTSEKGDGFCHTITTETSLLNKTESSVWQNALWCHDLWGRKWRAIWWTLGHQRMLEACSGSSLPARHVSWNSPTRGDMWCLCNLLMYAELVCMVTSIWWQAIITVYFELDKLTDITSGAVIQKSKELCSRHCCPDLLVICDNASQ